MELCPSSAAARPSSDQSFIQSKGSFILAQGYVVKNIANDDSDTQWVKTFEQSFISHEIFYCDPSSDPRGDCCPLEPQSSFDRAQRPSYPSAGVVHHNSTSLACFIFPCAFVLQTFGGSRVMDTCFKEGCKYKAVPHLVVVMES